MGKIVAILPARSGSKRIPNKNIKLFNGRPMIYWTIKSLKQSGIFDYIVVSTDSIKIANIANKIGAITPFIRPKKLSGSYTPTFPVIQHAIMELKKINIEIDYVCCAYPCSPFISPADIEEAFKFIKKNNFSRFTYPVSTYSHPPQRAMKFTTDKTLKYSFKKLASDGTIRTQDYEEYYHDTGQFYFGKTNVWLNKKNMHLSGYGKIIPSWRVVDIDNQNDWVRAENLFNLLNKSREFLIKKISIGTTSFGMKYGINNNQRITSKEEVKKIIRLSKLYGINSFDTAPNYGLSEKILGNVCNANEKIYTKTLQIYKKKITDEDINNINDTFMSSLNHLKRKQVDSLLVHKPDNLIGPGGERLYNWLINLKENKLINKIGISVSHRKELDKIIKKFKVDVVQLPMNILDQRFISSGHISHLSSSNIEVHTRSIFLQGLLLSNYKTLPKHLEKFKDKLKEINILAKERDISVLQLLTNFCFQNIDVDKFIFGVSSENQLKQIIKSINLEKLHDNFLKYSNYNKNLIIPANW